MSIDIHKVLQFFIFRTDTRKVYFPEYGGL